MTIYIIKNYTHAQAISYHSGTTKPHKPFRKRWEQRIFKFSIRKKKRDQSFLLTQFFLFSFFSSLPQNTFTAEKAVGSIIKNRLPFHSIHEINFLGKTCALAYPDGEKTRLAKQQHHKSERMCSQPGSRLTAPKWHGRKLERTGKVRKINFSQSARTVPVPLSPSSCVLDVFFSNNSSFPCG